MGVFGAFANASMLGSDIPPLDDVMHGQSCFWLRFSAPFRGFPKASAFVTPKKKEVCWQLKNLHNATGSGAPPYFTGFQVKWWFGGFTITRLANRCAFKQADGISGVRGIPSTIKSYVGIFTAAFPCESVSNRLHETAARNTLAAPTGICR